MGYLLNTGLYIPEASILNVVSFILGTILSLSSFTALFGGETTPYSKFGNRNIDNIPSKRAMLFIYLPSVIVCLLFQFPTLQWTSQYDIVHFLTTVHFVKRVIEVLFVHIYSSRTDLETVIAVGSAYTLTNILDLLVVRNIPESVFSKGLTSFGIVCFIAGEVINGYHHWLLRKMRLNKTDKKYHLPTGGLFNYALVPHYSSEQLTFLGLILISQNVVSASLRSFPFVYLTIRAYKTRIWYSANLDDKSEKAALAARKNLVPFVW